MKKLEELGISPWPWGAYYIDRGYSDVHSADDMLVSCVENPPTEMQVADTKLIAAAPDLYECLREAVEEMCHMTCEDTMDKCTKPESVCFVSKWRKALAKASGESEVK